jgi:hypothetical protein
MKKSLGILLIFTSIVILSCSSSNSGSRGHLQVFLQDSSAPFDSILINIQLVEIRPDHEYTDSTSGWVHLFDNPASYDMAKLRNGVRTQLCNREIVIGKYKTIRVQLGTCFAVRNDTLYNLEFPDDSYKTMVVEYPIVITNGQTSQALLDINLYTSITYNSDSSRFYFEPSFSFLEVDSTGGLEGYITPKSDIYLTHGTDTLGMTTTESNHYFGFFGLVDGYYNIYIFPRDTSYSNWVVEDIPVHPDTAFDVGEIQLPPR